MGLVGEMPSIASALLVADSSSTRELRIVILWG